MWVKSSVISHSALLSSSTQSTAVHLQCAVPAVPPFCHWGSMCVRKSVVIVWDDVMTWVCVDTAHSRGLCESLWYVREGNRHMMRASTTTMITTTTRKTESLISQIIPGSPVYQVTPWVISSQSRLWTACNNTFQRHTTSEATIRLTLQLLSGMSYKTKDSSSHEQSAHSVVPSYFSAMLIIKVILVSPCSGIMGSCHLV